MTWKPGSLFFPRIRLLAAAAVIVAALASSGQAREFPRGALKRLDDLPPGRFKSQLDALHPEARERARQWLNGLHFTDGDLPSMHAHSEGGICFACHFAKSHTTQDPPATTGTGATSDGPVVAAAAVPVSPFPSSLVFRSKPGAPNVLYINFAGETVTGTYWNTDPSVNRTSIPALAFSTDSDYATFSDAEQAIIKRVWQRMAEDYAPFDINVTTERPATFTTRTAVALITRNTDANGALNPFSTAGGVAYVNVFANINFAQYRPAWIYHNNLGNSEANIAEAASHEIGHNLGLSHDGTTAPLEYYGGHGGSSDPISWGPLMGTGYSRNVSQWSKGEYYLANNTEDDLAAIAGKVSYRTDDHGGSAVNATPLVVSQGTTIASTTPENDPTNSNTANKGVLERNTDVDVFTFLAGSGQATIDAKPWISPANTRGGNLDILLELYDDTGGLVASSNPATQTTATILTTLAAGRYFLHVRNSGAGTPLVSPPTGYTSYGSIGRYFLSGTIPDGSALLAYSATMDSDPGWTLDGLWQYGTPGYVTGGPSGGFTGTRIIGYNLSGNYENNLSVRYATTPTIDTTGRINLKLKFYRWLRIQNSDPISIQYSVDGSSWTNLWSASSAVSDSSWQAVEYPLPAEAANSPTLRLRWSIASGNRLSDIGWNIDDVEVFADLSPDSSPPMASLSVANLVAGGSAGHPCSVTYQDETAVSLASLDSSDLWVAGPNGFATAAGWVGADASTNRSPITGTYSIPPPGGSWDHTDNGTYTISLQPDAVEDVLGNSTPAATLGTFTVNVSPPPPGLLAVTPESGLEATGTQGGPFSPAAAVWTLSNTGGSPLDWNIGKEAAWLDLSAQTGTLQPGASVEIAVSLAPMAGTLAPGIYGETLVFANTTNANGNTTRGVTLTVKSPGVLEVTPAGDFAATGAGGGPFTPESATYTLANTGGSPLDWTAAKSVPWLDVNAGGGTLVPGATTNVTVSLNPAADQLEPGSYQDAVVVTSADSGAVLAIWQVNLTVTNPLKVINATTTINGQFQLTVLGPAGAGIVIESTTNFSSWTPIIETQIGEDGMLNVTDPESATLPARFYRVRRAP